jgi:hypothetical protein
MAFSCAAASLLFLTTFLQLLRTYRGIGRPQGVHFSSVIHLDGAIGMYQNDINGTYVKSTEYYNGFPRYLKRNTAGQVYREIWLEHYVSGPSCSWQVKPGYQKGQNNCYAGVAHSGDLGTCPRTLKWKQPTTFGPMDLDIKTFVDDAAEKEAVSSLPLPLLWLVLFPS